MLFFLDPPSWISGFLQNLRHFQESAKIKRKINQNQEGFFHFLENCLSRIGFRGNIKADEH